jgi:hypothetical protein
VTGSKPIAVLLQSISGVSAINPLVAFYDIHGGKREVLFFYFVPDTTRDSQNRQSRNLRIAQQFTNGSGVLFLFCHGLHTYSAHMILLCLLYQFNVSYYYVLE